MPYTRLGWDIMQNLQASLQISLNPTLIAALQPIFPSQAFNPDMSTIPPQIRKQVNLIVWDQEIPGRACHLTPIQIRLKDPTYFPCKLQYLIIREALLELQPTINKFLRPGRLIPCNSPCNMPIVWVKKPSGQYRSIKDYQWGSNSNSLFSHKHRKPKRSSL